MSCHLRAWNHGNIGVTVRALISLLWLGSTALRADPVELTHLLIEGHAGREFNRSYRFKIEVRQITVDKVAHRREHYWSHYDDQHEYVCSKFTILLDHRSVRIPEIAYTDLCYMQSVAPPEQMEDGRWNVKAECGSGGESYEIEFIFDASKLLERRVTAEVPVKTMVEVRKF